MDSKNFKEDRRRFMKYSLVAAASFVVAPSFLGRLSAVAAGDGKMVEESDPRAQPLGYYKDAKKVDVKKWPKRAGADGKTQFCDNCMFYQGADKKTGKCQIFAGDLVPAKAWCNSWLKKP